MNWFWFDLIWWRCGSRTVGPSGGNRRKWVRRVTRTVRTGQRAVWTRAAPAGSPWRCTNTQVTRVTLTLIRVNWLRREPFPCPCLSSLTRTPIRGLIMPCLILSLITVIQLDLMVYWYFIWCLGNSYFTVIM